MKPSDPGVVSCLLACASVVSVVLPGGSILRPVFHRHLKLPAGETTSRRHLEVDRLLFFQLGGAGVRGGSSQGRDQDQSL